MKYLQLFLLLILPLLGISQTEVETVNGRKYYVHYVEKGQTLYSIHKKYNVAIAEISKVNASVTDGLSIGEKLLIPIPVNNTDFYQNHVISKGETLYGISRSYKCKVSDLKSLNPELKDGIQIGQVIRVPKLDMVQSNTPIDQIVEDPVEDSQSQDNTSSGVSAKDTLVHHTVLAHETLYAIAKRYMVTADTIRKLNKINVNNISPGDVLIVPVKKVNYTISKNEIDANLGYSHVLGNSTEIIKKNSYKIVLLLPLMYSQNEKEMNRPLKVGEVEKLHAYTNIAADFYHGFKLALDSLSKAGLNAEVYVFDTQKDSNTVKRILNKPELRNVDMIFGPFFPNTVGFVSRYCKTNQIPMIIPFKTNNQVLYQNPFVYKTTASDMVQLDGVIDFVSDFYSKYNIVLVKPQSASDKLLFERAKSRYNSKERTGSVYNSNILEVNIGNSSGKELNLKLRKDTVNVVIVPSNDVKFITSVFMRLNNILNMNVYARDMKIIVFGLEDWNRIDDIDLKHRMRMEQHYASYRYLDYNANQTVDFFQNYRNAYGTDPMIYGVQGFDVGYYFLSAMYLYGENFHTFLPRHKVDLLQNKFEFKSVSATDGKENSSICIVKYVDYSLKFVTW